MKQKTICWFRQDLRLADNPALFEAAQQGDVLAIYILDEEEAGAFKMGAASRWYLHHSLESLNKSLNNKLHFYCGDALTIILNLVEKQGFNAVYWNRCYEPWQIKRDGQIKASIHAHNVLCKSFKASLLWEPWEILKTDGTAYKVFTPFYRYACLKAPRPRPSLPKPKNINFIQDKTDARSLASLALLSKINWHHTMHEYWQIGEAAAHKKLNQFLSKNLSEYKYARDFPEKNYTSQVSPCLHFGELSSNQIWYQTPSEGSDFLRQLVWREFSYYLLYHFPTLPCENFQNKFNQFPWHHNAKHLKAWQQGQTGYPIIDAGMRELWQTGYMHNRVRMIVASFLVKNLLIHWHAGEAWFWDCLVDADLANNSASWQWVAGSGVDAAPYFRIFNPITQGEKFDKQGHYTRYFVPELKNLPDKYLFKPWLAPDSVLKAAGIKLGQDYPKPIVDLAFSRQRALTAYFSIK